MPETGDNMAAKQENNVVAKNQELEIELLKAKLENLAGKISKPQNSEEAFQARVDAYEAKQAEREQLMQQIEKRRMQIWTENPKMRQDEVLLVEAWERRIKETESKNPHFAQMLRLRIKEKIKEVNQDLFR